MRKYSELRTNIYIAGYVLALMLLCTCSSPLVNLSYTDSSVFITMGRAMLKGKIMYKDLFDHKGLYIYFINCLSAMISNRSFIGLFIMEVIFMFVCARIVYALFSMYTSSRVSWIGMQIFLLFAMAGSRFEGGNSTEEYTLVFQLCSIYLVAKYFHSGMSEHPANYMLFHGITASIVLFLRPNMIMMWGAIALIAGIDLLIHKNFSGFFRNLTAGLRGMLIGATPVIIYAVMNNAVKDAVFAIFTYNFIYTASGSGLSIFTLLYRIASTLAKKSQIIFIAFILLSTVIMFIKRRALYFSAMLFMCIISVSLTGYKYGHYYMQLVPFCISFAYEAAYELNLLSESPLSMLNTKIIVMIIFAITCVQGGLVDIKAFLGIWSARNAGMEQFIKYNEPYYSDNEKVLVTGNNAVMYNLLGVIPQEKYFYTPLMKIMKTGDNIQEYDFYEAIESQITSIISGDNDVVIVTKNERGDIFSASERGEKAQEVLNSKYTLLYIYHGEYQDSYMYGRK